MVTDDPETPGDGHWEINLATTGAHTPGRWEVAALDADVNYGLGAHIQLKADVPWLFVKEEPEGWKSGLGAGDFGVKWRFLDREDSGIAMSTYPQLTHNLVRSSAHRGIASSNQEFFLPVEAATEAGGFALDAEIGRNFVEHAPDQWIAGVVVAHECAPDIECMAEVHETVSPADHQTLLNLGLHWKLTDDLVLLASSGRDFGPPSDDHRKLLFYLGIQVLR
jgi:hypothetical protein